MLVSILKGQMTRPADTTAYTAGDSVGTQMQFNPLGGAINLGGQIKALNVNTSQAAATPPDLELWLFSAPLAATPVDNAAFAPAAADMLNLVGVVPVPTASFKKTSARQACMITTIDIPVPGYVYGYLVVRNAYTPVSAEVINVVLNVLADYGTP